MAQSEYKWQRRWIPVYEGGSDGTGATPGAPVTFDKIQHVPCLILLGESGMGKTEFIEGEQKRLCADPPNSVDQSFLQDLTGSETGDEVRRRLFARDVYRCWKTGTHRLTLFVDSIDQAGMPVGDLVRAICNELADADVSRLHLRLVCRDHDWSLTFANRLARVWQNDDEKESKVRAYQLAPLDFDDIRIAVEANSDSIKDPESFLQEIEAADAWALARVPITLNMLLKYPGYLKSTRTELYERGMIEFCEDTDTTSGSKPLEVAARIAAVMMLSRKHSVDVNAPDVPESSSALAVKDLLLDAASEREEKQIRAVLLDTPLFQGPKDRRTWTHQSYAEYLAAYCLSNESVLVREISRKTVAPDGKFPSHLHDTLGWLIGMRPEVLPEVIARQPMLGLRADLPHLCKGDFETLFTAILSLPDPYVYSHEIRNLRQFRARRRSARDYLLQYLADTNRFKRIRRLVFPIVDRLAIQRFQKHFERIKQARRFAFRLTECFDIRDIDDLLVELVRDRQEDLELRQWAARRILELGSIQAMRRLKPFIDSRDDDPRDELKGYALQALWPDQLTADELFSALSPPKNRISVSAYGEFLYSDSIISQLHTADLATALRWVADQPSDHELPFELNDLPRKIMRKAWENIRCEGVMGAFAEATVAMIMRSDGLFTQSPNMYPPNKELDEFEKDFVAASDLRRELVLLSLPHLLHTEREVYSLMHCWPPLVVADDLDWLLKRLDPEKETNVEIRTQAAQLIESLLPSLRSQNKTLPERNRDIEKVYCAAERYPELTQLTQQNFDEVNLKDPAYDSEREHVRQRKEIDEQIAQQRAEVRPFERLQEALDLMKAGETLGWIYVCAALTSIPSETHSPWGLKPDLMDFPTWQSCDDETQERVVRAALAYVLGQDVISTEDNSEDWYDTGSPPRVEFFGYSAIFLLLKTGANALSQLPPDRWKRWSKIIVWYPYANSFSDGRIDYLREIHGLQEDLLRRLHRNAPRALLDNFRSLLVAQDPVTWQELNKLGHLLGSELEGMLLDLLRDSDVSPSGRRSILDFMLGMDSIEALRIAEATIASGYTNQNEKDLVIEIAVFLIISDTEFDRSLLWALLHNDNAVRHTIVDKLAEEDWHAGRCTKKASVVELADLFIWVEERYPTSEDPQIGRGSGLSTRDQIVYWRNGILSELRTREIREALPEIRRIRERFPKHTSVQRIQFELEKAVEGSGWKPATPKEVLELCKRYEEIRENPLKALVRWILADKRWLIGILMALILGLPQIIETVNRFRSASAHTSSTITTPPATSSQALNQTKNIPSAGRGELATIQVTLEIRDEDEAGETATPSSNYSNTQHPESPAPSPATAES